MDKEPFIEDTDQKETDRVPMRRAKFWAILSVVIAVIVIAWIVFWLLVIADSTDETFDSQDTALETSSEKDASKLQPYPMGTAPYAYIAWQGSLTEMQKESSVQNYIAAFMLSSSDSECTPAWDGDPSLGLDSARSEEIVEDLINLRSNDGDVILSFGGQSGTVLAQSCKSSSDLKNAYMSVIDKYDLDKIDFDIEGEAETDLASIERRSEALVDIQNEVPNLKIWVTLPVTPDGLDQKGLDVVKTMRDKGVLISGVNIMTMDYGMGTEDMGKAAISSAIGVFDQLKGLYSQNTDDDVWGSIGITPMIGVNDTTPEVFTLDNAKTVRDFAIDKKIGMISQWNMLRDKSCPDNAAILSDSCSGVVQSPYQFIQTLSIE